MKNRYVLIHIKERCLHFEDELKKPKGKGKLQFEADKTVRKVGDVNSIVSYKTQQEWLDYMQNGYGDGSGGCYVLNCGLATALGLLPLTN